MSDLSQHENDLLGARLRQLREARKLTMRDLGARAGLSASYLSQIENGKANVTIQTLRKLASVFGVAWSDLFAVQHTSSRVLRKADRRRLDLGPGQRDFGIAQLPLVDVDVAISEYEPGAVMGDDEYVHEDLHEIFVLIRGRMRFRLDGVDHDLEAGDSVDFRSSTPHMLTNIGDVLAEGLWVVSPPAGTTNLHE